MSFIVAAAAIAIPAGLVGAVILHLYDVWSDRRAAQRRARRDEPLGP